MKTATVGLLLSLVALLLAPDAYGYKVDDDGHGHLLHWKNGAASYYLASGNNPAGSSGEAAIHAAFKTWSDASTNLQYTFAGYLAQGTQAYDGKNVVYWNNGPWPYDSTLAAITWHYYDTSNGNLLDADVVFRSDGFTWGVGGNGYDIQNSATHEIGHFSGLAHSTVATATMYYSTFVGETAKRTLDPDDLAGLAQIYGGVTSTTTNTSTAASSSSTVATRDRIGVYRPSTGMWYLDRNGSGAWEDCSVDGCLGAFGTSTARPVVGHWSGGTRSELGVFRASAGAWATDPNANGKWDGCGIDGCASPFGVSGDVGVAGDWTNSGASKLGVFRASNGMWYLDANSNGTWDGCSIDRCFGPFGVSGDMPVVGDWTGNGTSKIGVYRPSEGRWYLDKNGDGQWSGCSVDRCVGPFGITGDVPVAGDWTGNGTSKIGVYRPSTGLWYLDVDGQGQWNGCTVDSCLGPFGIAGDLPVVGKW